MQDVGSLRPYQSRTVKLDRRLDFNIGEGNYQWYLFVRDIELLHSLMAPGEFREELSARALRVRQGTEQAEAAPYLTFPPRIPRGAGHVVKLPLKIARSGAVTVVTAAGDDRSEAATALAEAARHWWFLPKYEKGRATAARVDATVDLAKAGAWSNERVQLTPVVEPPEAASAASDRLQLSPVEQARSELLHSQGWVPFVPGPGDYKMVYNEFFGGNLVERLDAPGCARLAARLAGQSYDDLLRDLRQKEKQAQGIIAVSTDTVEDRKVIVVSARIAYAYDGARYLGTQFLHLKFDPTGVFQEIAFGAPVQVPQE
jgi:hypothetical protein